MRTTFSSFIFIGLMVLQGAGCFKASGQNSNTVSPVIPVGYDAYRMWDQWPTQRIGVRAYMRSTHDRSGGNEYSDASHFLFMNEEDHNVTLDVKGKGILYFFRANGRTYYGTGYYIYHLFANEAELSQPIKSFELNRSPDKDVLDLIENAVKDIAPLDIAEKTGKKVLDRDLFLVETIQAETPQQIRALKLTIPLENAFDLERIRLVATWDDAKYPSIDAPLCLFFAAGTFYNHDEKEYLVKSLPINIRYDYPNKKIELACYFPMPFFKSAKFELSGINQGNIVVDYEIRYEPLKVDPAFSSYFHATYNDIPNPELGKDMVFLDTKGLEFVTWLVPTRAWVPGQMANWFPVTESENHQPTIAR